MAIQVKITTKLSADGIYLTVTDTTGAYSLANTGGWGAPNLALSTVVAARLIVTGQDNSVYTINVLPLGLPNSTQAPTVLTWEQITTGITPLNPTVPFPDGLYTFKYEIDILSFPGPLDATLTYTVTEYFYFAVKKCVYRLLADVQLCGCDCEADSVKIATDAYILLIGSIANACSSNREGVAKLLKLLQTYCSFSPCKSC
jgi:hypothetical protein